MADTKVSVAAKALVFVGLNPISSFDDDSLEAETARVIYDEVIDGCLSERAWRFATTQKQLNRLMAAPVSEWDAAYQLPGDPPALRIIRVSVDDEPIRFDRYADKLLCNAGENDAVVLEYVYRAPEADWPPYFRKYVTETLASYFASSIMRNPDLIREHMNMAAFEQQNAYTADSQGRTQQVKRARQIVRRRR